MLMGKSRRIVGKNRFFEPSLGMRWLGVGVPMDSRRGDYFWIPGGQNLCPPISLAKSCQFSFYELCPIAEHCPLV